MVVHLRLLLSCVLALTVASAAELAPSAARAQSTHIVTSLVSEGSGSQQFVGGGLTYGTLSYTPGATRQETFLLVKDLSKKHNMHLRLSMPKSQLKVQRTPDGRVFHFPAGRSLAFKVSGSRFRLVLSGKSLLNGVGLFGKAWLVGDGTYSLSGATDEPWPGGQVPLGTATKPPATTTTASRRVGPNDESRPLQLSARMQGA